MLRAVGPCTSRTPGACCTCCTFCSGTWYITSSSRESSAASRVGAEEIGRNTARVTPWFIAAAFQ
jgi:hypothetical protein